MQRSKSSVSEDENMQIKRDDCKIFQEVHVTYVLNEG